MSSNQSDSRIPVASVSDASSKFDPLRTRTEQGLAPLPKIAVSLSEQRKLLSKAGLREKTVFNDNGEWVIVERLPRVDTIASEPTLCKHGVDLKELVCTDCLGTTDIEAYDAKMLAELNALTSQSYYPYVGRVVK